MNVPKIFEPFVKKGPIPMIVRVLIERLFNPEILDEWFKGIAEKQYTRDLLFSTLFEIMSDVVCGRRKTVNAAYQSRSNMSVSITSVYNKLNGIETKTSAELVRYAAKEVSGIIQEMGGSRTPLLPGYQTKLLDGNCIEASEHRIEELRSLASGALPGKSLVVYDPALRLPIDVFPCEDGHAQERSLLKDVLQTVEASDVWIADRNFCTRNFLAGIANAKAFFIIRQHAKLPWESIGKEVNRGRVKTGKVFEQKIRVIDEKGISHVYRRIRLVLKKKTRDGDKEICIITNLSRSAACGKLIAELYRKRWTIETAFQELTDHLNSEINTLGYPPAALFAFCLALVTYMIFSVMKAALSVTYGAETVDKKVSGYYISQEISATYGGMLVAIDEKHWRIFRKYNRHQIAELLIVLSNNIKLSTLKKHSRGPKKEKVAKKYDPKHPHVSTHRLIADRKNKK